MSREELFLLCVVCAISCTLAGISLYLNLSADSEPVKVVIQYK